MNIATPLKLTKDAEKLFSCELCGRDFTRKANLRSHLLIHNGIKPHRCEECGDCFVQKNTLMRHMLRHTGEKKFQCKICAKAFTLQATLYNHMTVHSKDKRYECSKCQKSFKQKSNLRQHELMHFGIRKYGCTQCNKRFFQKCRLREHLLTHDKGQVKGREQGKMFSAKEVLESHQLSHNDGNEFECDICKKIFTSEGSLTSHTLLHGGEKYHSCDSCGRTFRRKSALLRHLVTHTEKKRRLPNVTRKQKNLHKCKECKQVFHEKEDLTAHLLILAGCGEKKFVCEICASTFTKKTALSNHNKSHKEQKVLHCPVCNKSSSNSPEGKNKKSVPCCMRKSMCIRCMKYIYIRANAVGEASSFLCESCRKESDGNFYKNLSHFKGQKEIFKSHDNSSVTVESPDSEKIRENKEDIVDNGPVGNTEFYEGKEDKEVLDIGQDFLDCSSNGSQIIEIPVVYIKEEQNC